MVSRAAYVEIVVRLVRRKATCVDEVTRGNIERNGNQVHRQRTRAPRPATRISVSPEDQRRPELPLLDAGASARDGPDLVRALERAPGYFEIAVLKSSHFEILRRMRLLDLFGCC